MKRAKPPKPSLRKPKPVTSFRMSETAQGLLDQLSERTGLSRANCLELAIRELARRQGVEA